jgi:hypothetical protein
MLINSREETESSWKEIAKEILCETKPSENRLKEKRGVKSGSQYISWNNHEIKENSIVKGGILRHISAAKAGRRREKMKSNENITLSAVMKETIVLECWRGEPRIEVMSEQKYYQAAISEMAICQSGL